MKPFFILLVLTLAFGHTLRAANTEIEIITNKNHQKQSYEKPEALEELSISKAPKVAKNTQKLKPYFFPYQHSLGFYGAYNYLVDLAESKGGIGITYDYYHKPLKTYSFTFDAIGGDGRFEIGQKIANSLEGTLRGHHGWALAMSVDADKGLANIINFKKFFLGLYIGGEYYFSDPFSVRSDIKFLVGKDEIYNQINFHLTYSW